mgnify:FL=1
MSWSRIPQRFARLAKRILRKALLMARFGMLLIWHSIVGPPRILCFDEVTNAWLLRAFGAEVSRNNVRLHSPITLHNASSGFHNLKIGANSVLNGNNFLDLTKPVTLEEGVSLAPGVIVMTHNAFNDNPFLEDRLSRLVGSAPVTIMAGAGIKANAVILHGTAIGRESLVAGGSIVARDVPERAYVSGIPARIRKTL